MGDLSAHFSRSEMWCHHCRRLDGEVVPELLAGLEALRDMAFPRGLQIVSGYRCRRHNRAVGGATDSQHLWRAAADIPLVATLADVRALGVFSGIGWQMFAGRQLVRHVDVRHASGHNRTRSTPQHPAIWRYDLSGRVVA